MPLGSATVTSRVEMAHFGSSFLDGAITRWLSCAFEKFLQIALKIGQPTQAFVVGFEHPNECLEI
jgi:hypothetical protein